MITSEDIIYLILVDRFYNADTENDFSIRPDSLEVRHGGDLRGILEKIPYLRELGITTLWLNPLYPNPPASYHGYHPLDFESIAPYWCSPELGPEGTLEVVRTFISEVHRSGMKVILDTIICHTAQEHPWCRERPDWFNVSSSDITKWWIWGLPDLNHDRLDVNCYFADNLCRWIDETGADGIRIDAARHIERGFWEVFKCFVQQDHPETTIIGEVWDHDVLQVAPYQNQLGFDGMFDYPLYEALRGVFLEEAGFGLLARPGLSENEPLGVFDQDHNYRDPHQLVTFLDNHDTPRLYDVLVKAAPHTAMRCYHLALILLFAMRGIPQLYYGDELSMLGGIPPDNRRDMNWTRVYSHEPQSMATLSLIQHLIRIRKNSKALQHGTTVTLYSNHYQIAFARIYRTEMCIAIFNLSDEFSLITIPLHENKRLLTYAFPWIREGEIWTDMVDEANTLVIKIVSGALTMSLPPNTGYLLHPVTNIVSVDSV